MPPTHVPVAADITGIKLAYAGDNNANDPYAGFEARIVPENITLLPKTANQITGGNPVNERIVIAKKGDTVASVLRELGATPDEIAALANRSDLTAATAASKKARSCAC